MMNRDYEELYDKVTAGLVTLAVVLTIIVVLTTILIIEEVIF